MDAERLKRLADMGDEDAARALVHAQARETTPYALGRNMEMPVARLPADLRSVLRNNVGYSRATVTVNFAMEAAHAATCAFPGNRAECHVYNETKGRKITMVYRGGWGGGWDEPDMTPKAIPQGTIVMHGESGGKGTFVHLTMRPDDAARWIARETHTDMPLDEKERLALATLMLKSSYRKSHWTHAGEWCPTLPALVSLIHKGFAKKHGKGIAATAEGKAYAHNNRLRAY